MRTLSLTTEDQTLNRQRKVCIVDDEPAVLDFTRRVTESAGYSCEAFRSVRDFLAVVDESVECVITDLRMPDDDGMSLIEQLCEKGLMTPVIVLTGHADVPTTVQLMERGVVTLVEKPFESQQLLRAVERAIGVSASRQLRRDEAHRILAQFHRLTEEERGVMREMVHGASNKAIAMQLCISSRTLDRRRRTVLDTMGVDSVAELAAISERHRLFQ